MSNFNLGAPNWSEHAEPGEPFELYYIRRIEDFHFQESFTRAAVPALRKEIEDKKLLFDPETFRIRFKDHPQHGPIWEASIEVRERLKVG